MNELPPNEIAQAKLGTLPAVEALAFAARALQDWLEYRLDERIDRTAGSYAKWRPFKRGGKK